MITPSVIEKITSMAKNKSIPVCVDPKKRNFSEYKNADLFKPNLKELKEGLKIDNILPQKDSLKSAADILHSTMGIGKVFITLSEYGVFIADYQSQTPSVHLLDAQLRKIADVSGAGDTVISVAALCMALGIPTDELSKISNMSGGLVCESVGVVPIDKTRLLSELQRYE
ncbi:MAG: PfkB family carbohydrate kinase [Bacteroidales bacterium]|nr:PfkB family carbohydrate kinase [Bacteroidales bacterium]